MKTATTIISIVVISATLFSCAFAPINNQYEKAGTLKKGNIELSGNYTSYSITGDGESAKSNDNVGFRAGYGLSDKFDIKIRYERLVPAKGFEDGGFNDEIKGINYISIVPKIALIPEKLSLLIPLSHYSYKDLYNGEVTKEKLNSIAPLLIYTISNNRNKADYSFGLKADYIFGNDGGTVLLGTTIGAGFSNDLRKWAIRPELGAIFPGGGAILSYGIGFQFIIPANKKQK